jgi:iron(III) transport system substrate-binding protein
VGQRRRPTHPPRNQPPRNQPPPKPAAQPTQATAASETLDALYARAKDEGTVALYGSLNPTTTKVVFAAFEKPFPGLKIDWVDGTREQLIARIIAEKRGGKVLADVIETNIDGVGDLRRQSMLTDFDFSLPEAAPYPSSLRGTDWIASDLKFYVVGWNASLVKPGEEPRGFEDLADPRWKGKLIEDPDDVELLIGLARGKYRSDEPALDLLKRLAANSIEFHTGHSEVVELLLAGQAAVCVTCFSHHFPPRLAKSAPVGYTLSEGIGLISA